MENRTNSESFRFCPRCGAARIAWKSRKEIRCEGCGFFLFLNVASAVAAVITRGGQILLTVRGIEPGRGMLDLPGGFLEPGETGEGAIRRELEEELGIEVDGVTYLFSFPNRYPCGGLVYDVLDLFYRIELKGAREFFPQDDVASILWVEGEEIDFDRIAFESIRHGLRRYLDEASSRR